MVKNILQYLNWEDVCQLMIASPAREQVKQDLLKIPGLFRQIFTLNTDKGLRIPTGLLKLSPGGIEAKRRGYTFHTVVSLNPEELLSLDPEELLGLRLDMGGNTADHQIPVLLEHPMPNMNDASGYEVVAFHPRESVVALRVSSIEISVHLLSKDSRFERGTQLFCRKIVPGKKCYFRFANDPEVKFTGVRWSPDGRYLLASLAELDERILKEENLGQLMEDYKHYGSLMLFEYSHSESTMRQILFKEEQIYYDLTMLSHCQWLDNTSFLVAAPPNRTGLYWFQLQDNHTGQPELQVHRLILDCHNPWRGVYSDLKLVNYDKTTRGNPKRQFMQGHRTFAFVGAYFGLDTEVSANSKEKLAVFGFVTGCPKLHVHPRVAIMKADKNETGEVTAVIDIPGNLVSLEVYQNILYILYIFEVGEDEKEYNCQMHSLQQGHSPEEMLFSCPLIPGNGFKTFQYYQIFDDDRICRYGLVTYDYKNNQLTQINR